MPTYSHTCDFCHAETLASAKLTSVSCSGCKRLLSGLGDKDWDLDDDAMEMDEAYDPVKDKYKTAAQLWGEKVSRFFCIGMRLDSSGSPGGSKVGSVVASRPTVGKWTKTMPGKVSSVKGGRKGGSVVMGGAARDASGRGAGGGHRDEEWLHLWGDNLGGPSAPANFVAGSYAANTEMLVIEQALALNLSKTLDLGLEVTALCSAQHVGEYAVYKLIPPKSTSTGFEHWIDLDNRYFTKADQAHVDSLVGAWLKDNDLLAD